MNENLNGYSQTYHIIIPILLIIAVDEPPNIISHPDSLKEVRPGKAVAFTVQATGTQPLTYEWQWKPAENGDENKEWHSCDVEGPTLTIPHVQKSDEGQYRCVIHNHAGRQISEPAQLEVRDQPESIFTVKFCVHTNSKLLRLCIISSAPDAVQLLRCGEDESTG